MNDLTVGDGFKFGCGFMLAAVLAWLGMTIVSVIIAVIFSGALAGLLAGLVDSLGSVAPVILSVI
jgi:hypothetical protein